MAVEVNAREFIFLPFPERDPLSKLSKASATRLPSNLKAVPWFHNPIHDMESAWWIALWAFRDFEDGLSPSLFTESSLRRGILTSAGSFLTHCSALPTPVIDYLEDWLLFMRSEYTKLEKLVSDHSYGSFDYDYVFKFVIQFIEAIIEVLEPDSTTPGTEELDNSAEAFPNKRRKA
jgi:hypothetical protein